tara:strand:+ start:2089 stop:2508 length:420 start_codon:yes stop_codon:yes gene_type:complete
MERDNKSSSNKKKGLSFISITSFETKKNIITKLNETVDNYAKSNSIDVNQIPLAPIPNISFWISEEEKRCGMTISRENCKWGWVYLYDGNKWNPCSYMTGMGLDKIVFTEEENLFFTKILSDCCCKYTYPQEIAKRNNL